MSYSDMVENPVRRSSRLVEQNEKYEKMLETVELLKNEFTSAKALSELFEAATDHDEALNINFSRDDDDRRPVRSRIWRQRPEYRVKYKFEVVDLFMEGLDGGKLKFIAKFTEIYKGLDDPIQRLHNILFYGGTQGSIKPFRIDEYLIIHSALELVEVDPDRLQAKLLPDQEVHVVEEVQDFLLKILKKGISQDGRIHIAHKRDLNKLNEHLVERHNFNAALNDILDEWFVKMNELTSSLDEKLFEKAFKPFFHESMKEVEKVIGIDINLFNSFVLTPLGQGLISDELEALDASIKGLKNLLKEYLSNPNSVDGKLDLLNNYKKGLDYRGQHEQLNSVLEMEGVKRRRTHSLSQSPRAASKSNRYDPYGLRGARPRWRTKRKTKRRTKRRTKRKTKRKTKGKTKRRTKRRVRRTKRRYSMRL